MNLLNGVIKISDVSYLIFSIMIIVALGYLLGRITIKGVSLGTAGVFVVSLLYGAFFYEKLTNALQSAFGWQQLRICPFLQRLMNLSPVLPSR